MASLIAVAVMVLAAVALAGNPHRAWGQTGQVTLSVDAFGEIQAGSEPVLLTVPIKVTIAGVAFGERTTAFNLSINPGTEVILEAPAEAAGTDKLFFLGWKAGKTGPWVLLEKTLSRVIKQNETITAVYSVRPEAPALPDLMITSLVLGTPDPIIGEAVAFVVKIENRGQASAGAFDIEALGDRGGKDRQTVSFLTVHGSTEVTLRAIVAAEQENFTITLDPEQRLSESNKANNRLQIRVQARAASPQPPAPTGPESLSWNLGDVNVSVSQVCLFGVCLNMGTIDSTFPFPFDLASTVDRLGIQSAQQTQNGLPKDVTLTLDFVNKSGKLAGPAPSSNTSAQAGFDLFNSMGEKVAVLTVTVTIVLQGATPGPTPLPGSGVIVTVRAALNSGAQINGVPITTNFGVVQTPGQLTVAVGTNLTLRAPAMITLSGGGGTRSFRQWLYCVGISCLAFTGTTLTLPNITTNAEVRAIYN
jgi:hypothetical protein